MTDPKDRDERVQDNGEVEEGTSVEEGMLLDYITGEPIKDNAKEQVRQRIARALFHEYGIPLDDMARDFRMKVDGRRKKLDLAIFEAGQPHEVEHLRRLVVCQKEPPRTKKGAYKMRDHDQAKKEFGLLHAAMTEAPNCRYGLWTNGLEFFFFDKEVSRFDVRFKPLGDWPMADESIGTRDVVSSARLRKADPEMLRTAFRRCHNFIHGNEGMPKDAAFWQFLYLIFAKMHDEKRGKGEEPRFWAGATEQFDPKGRQAIRARIEPLFEEVKREYGDIFDASDRITLSDRALAFMVSELARYDFGRTDVDAKGVAYQEIVGDNLRGDRGQYFTPRGAIRLMAEMLDPKSDERVFDPACGTGGFLIASISHLERRYRERLRLKEGAELNDEQRAEVRQIQRSFAERHLFGADFDRFLVKASKMNVVMASGAEPNVFHLNSLEFRSGHLPGVEPARKLADLGTMDVVMTNPPFGSEIPVTDPNILQQFELAHGWSRTDDGAFVNTGRLQGSVSPEVLFIERCVDWLKPGGRMGIVLPDGILGNPGDEYIRWWILRHCWVLASVDLPVEVFIVEANVNILTSLLFLKKKTQQEIQAEDLGATVDYPVFMAVAEKVGFDRRGNTLYKRSPDGEELVDDVDVVERVRVNGSFVERVLRRKDKIVDSDLPYEQRGRLFLGPIAEAYREFRAENEEPGS